LINLLRIQYLRFSINVIGKFRLSAILISKKIPVDIGSYMDLSMYNITVNKFLFLCKKLISKYSKIPIFSIIYNMVINGIFPYSLNLSTNANIQNWGLAQEVFGHFNFYT
jgi:hypothetical protein